MVGESGGPPQKISGSDVVKSCSSRQDKHRNALPQNPGNFCDDFKKENVEKGWPFHTFDLGKWLEIFKLFFYMNVRYRRAKWARKKIRKRLRQSFDPFFYIILPIKPTHRTPSLTNLRGPRPSVPLLWIRPESDL